MNRDLFADLHIHTQQSDGRLQFNNLTKYAKDKNLSAIAITDHDKTHPEITEPIITKDGIDIISGIELRVQPEELDERIDILGYGVQNTEKLRSMTEEVQTNRKERVQKIIDLIDQEYGVKLDLEPEKHMGRPHIARSIADNNDLDHNYNSAFENIIGRDCPCYISRDIPTFEEGINVLNDACSLLSLAHPLRYNSPEKALELTDKLDGIECHYNYAKNPSLNPYLPEIKAKINNKTITGGSDAHDFELGKSGLTEKEYVKFLKDAGLYREYFIDI